LEKEYASVDNNSSAIWLNSHTFMRIEGTFNSFTRHALLQIQFILEDSDDNV
jgi:hypothetical protein